MFQTAILGSFSTQLKVSEVQGLAIWIYKLLNFLWFLGGVGGQKWFTASWDCAFLKFRNSLLYVNFPFTNTCRVTHNFKSIFNPVFSGVWQNILL